ncbi:MAG: sensor histidine kinase [Sphaerochaeta sp.]|uniref:ATP-binding protein n=1 Tax=Sphaerochaeta sp. TaxID=1972642 RepID=UPI002978481C|nr:sensor histidine kinase [uncultured Sphaerochaeta sp.]MDD3929389.1 sensor histidine kinase [Sphaerochaeta sp.]
MHICIDDYLLDIVQNSFEAASSLVELVLDETESTLACLVRDNGKGMDAEVQKRVLDPFYSDGKKHAKRKVGLGLPFLSQACEACQGTFALHSEVGVGTTVEFSFNLAHLDAPPMGNLVSTFVALLGHPLAQELVIRRSVNTSKGSGNYSLSKQELEDVLGGLSTSGALNLLREYINSQEEAVMTYHVEPKMHSETHRTQQEM